MPRHLIIFFFSSRRRHTSLSGDWSSDVCSSDLIAARSPGRGWAGAGIVALARQPRGGRSRRGPRAMLCRATRGLPVNLTRSNPMAFDRRDFLKLALQGAAASAWPFAAAPVRAAGEGQGTRWIILGSKGGPRVTGGRSNPANVLLVDGVPYVVDCGYGVAKRLVEAKVALPSVRYIFITHLHSDHVLEFGNMVYSAWSAGLNHEVDAFGPVGLAAWAKAFWESNRFDVEIRIPDEGKPDPRKLLVVNEIDDSGPVVSTDRVRVSAFRTPHPPILKENYAYRFETPGGVIVYACDTAYNPKLADFARGADVLIHEALYVPGVDALTARIANAATLKEHLLAAHTTTEDVGRIAQAAGVKKLVLSHLVPGDDPSITDAMWTEGARKHYAGDIVVARDMMQIDLEELTARAGTVQARVPAPMRTAMPPRPAPAPRERSRCRCSG